MAVPTSTSIAPYGGALSLVSPTSPASALSPGAGVADVSQRAFAIPALPSPNRKRGATLMESGSPVFNPAEVSSNKRPATAGARSPSPRAVSIMPSVPSATSPTVAALSTLSSPSSSSSNHGRMSPLPVAPTVPRRAASPYAMSILTSVATAAAPPSPSSSSHHVHMPAPSVATTVAGTTPLHLTRRSLIEAAIGAATATSSSSSSSHHVPTPALVLMSSPVHTPAPTFSHTRDLSVPSIIGRVTRLHPPMRSLIVEYTGEDPNFLVTHKQYMTCEQLATAMRCWDVPAVETYESQMGALLHTHFHQRIENILFSRGLLPDDATGKLEQEVGLQAIDELIGDILATRYVALCRSADLWPTYFRTPSSSTLVPVRFTSSGIEESLHHSIASVSANVGKLKDADAVLITATYPDYRPLVGNTRRLMRKCIENDSAVLVGSVERGQKPVDIDMSLVRDVHACKEKGIIEEGCDDMALFFRGRQPGISWQDRAESVVGRTIVMIDSMETHKHRKKIYMEIGRAPLCSLLRSGALNGKGVMVITLISHPEPVAPIQI